MNEKKYIQVDRSIVTLAKVVLYGVFALLIASALFFNSISLRTAKAASNIEHKVESIRILNENFQKRLVVKSSDLNTCSTNDNSISANDNSINASVIVLPQNSTNTPSNKTLNSVITSTNQFDTPPNKTSKGDITSTNQFNTFLFFILLIGLLCAIFPFVIRALSSQKKSFGPEKVLSGYPKL